MASASVGSLGWGKLARDDRGAAAVAILENLEQVAALLVLWRSQTPVIEEEDVHPRELAEEPAVGAVGTRQAEVIEQAGGSAVVGAVAAAAGLVSQGTGDEALARAGRAGDEDLLVLGDPAAGGELADHGLVELPAGRIVDGLDTGLRQLELGFLEGPGQAFVLPGEPLGVDEQPEPLIEAERRQFGVVLLFGPGLGHGRQFESVQLVEGRGGEHRASLLVVVPPADMPVDGSEGEGLDRRGRGQPVESVLEDGVDMTVGADADGQGPSTGGLEAGGAVAAAEAEQSQAGAVPLLGMRAVGVGADIMSLGGIAIAIGAMIDAAIVMIENMHKHLERAVAAKDGTGRGDRWVDTGVLTRREHWQVVLASAQEVGPALFLSLLIITVSFIPVFALEGQEGRLFHPLAYTKSFAMAAASLLAVTLVPVTMGRSMVPKNRGPTAGVKAATSNAGVAPSATATSTCSVSAPVPGT